MANTGEFDPMYFFFLFQDLTILRFTSDLIEFVKIKHQKKYSLYFTNSTLHQFGIFQLKTLKERLYQNQPKVRRIKGRCVCRGTNRCTSEQKNR